MMLEFNVRNQEISRIDSFSPAEKSVNYLIAKFNFKTEDWDGANKIAVFKNLKTKKEYDRILEEDACIVPSEALSENGQFEVSVYGLKDGQKITSNVATCNLNRTLSGGSMTDDDSLNAAEKLLLEAKNKITTPSSAKVGQVLSVKEVDENGKPIDFEAVEQGNVSDEQIQESVDRYLDENPVEVKVPTKTSELENDSNFATQDFVEQEIANFDFIKIVTELPQTGLPNRTYLVAKTDAEDNDLYDEYLWVNGAWEFVGTKKIEVHLTEYYKKEEFDEIIKEYLKIPNGTGVVVYNATTGEVKVYGTSVNSPGISQVVMTTGYKTIRTETPQNDLDAANKKYVDDLFKDYVTEVAELVDENLALLGGGENE